MRNRWKRFKQSFCNLNHRAEATVLMRSLRVLRVLGSTEVDDIYSRTPSSSFSFSSAYETSLPVDPAAGD